MDHAVGQWAVSLQPVTTEKVSDIIHAVYLEKCGQCTQLRIRLQIGPFSNCGTPRLCSNGIKKSCKHPLTWRQDISNNTAYKSLYFYNTMQHNRACCKGTRTECSECLRFSLFPWIRVYFDHHSCSTSTLCNWFASDYSYPFMFCAEYKSLCK